jgi:hypothetical protein
MLYSGNFIERFGEDRTAIALREHLRCSSHRDRKASLRQSVR